MAGGLYEVGVHLLAVDGVSGVLAALSKSVLGLHGSIQELNHGFAGMNTALIGAATGTAGVLLGEAMAKIVEHGSAIEHWKSQMEAAGASSQNIADAVSTAWGNANTNMNATAADGLKNIIELNKATGDWSESMKLLPGFSVAQAAMQSVKAEDLHSHFNEGAQTLNFARSLEEIGATQRGRDAAGNAVDARSATATERQANVEFYAREMLKTMISSRGLIDGNSLYALTNNSGGAAQNWDTRMATVIAPIMGEIMRAGKMGNADYMALRALQGGHIDSQSVHGLVKSGLLDPSETTGEGDKMKLNANSKFAEGIPENIWTWSEKKLQELQARGVDTNDQKTMNEIINSVASNKSLATMLRAVMEPASRQQIQKEVNLRDQVPQDAAGVLQDKDPWLKLDALKKKWDDFLTALGSPMVEPAMKALDTMTHGINAIAQSLAAHPDAARDIGLAAAGLAGVLTVLGGAAVLAGIAALLPGGVIAAGVGALGGIVTAIAALHWDQIKTASVDVLKAIPGEIAAAMAGIGSAFTSEIAKLPGEVAGGIAAAIGAIGSALSSAISGLGGGLTQGAPSNKFTPPGQRGLLDGLRQHSSWQGSIGAPHRQTASLTVPVTVQADGRTLATVVTRHQVAMAKYPTSIGPADSRGSYQGPGANDWAWS